MFIDAVSEVSYDLFAVPTEREKETFSKADGKTRTVFEKNRVLSCSNVEVASSWGGTLQGEVRWGGNDGVQGNVSASGGVKDDKGNSVDVKVEQNTDGSGKASVSVSHTEKEETSASHTDKKKN